MRALTPHFRASAGAEPPHRRRRSCRRNKVRAHRERWRRRGLRRIQIWVPDVRSPAFQAEAHRQSLAVAGSPHAAEDQDFIDAVADQGGK
ncbi:MAG TPA: antitoxin MazE family protein [Geminicoccaceae bacterium]